MSTFGAHAATPREPTYGETEAIAHIELKVVDLVRALTKFHPGAKEAEQAIRGAVGSVIKARMTD